MLSFIYVLILSLMFLAPHQGPRTLGWGIALLSAAMIGITAFSVIQSRRQAGGGEAHEQFLGRRRRTTGVGHLAAIFIGAAMATRRDPYQAYWLLGVVAMQLGNAAGSAWDLLVEVGK